MMNPEVPANTPLTDDQKEAADFILEMCPELVEHADDNFEMMGLSGTVYYGLGRCANHLSNMTPKEITEMVMTKVEQQKAEES